MFRPGQLRDPTDGKRRERQRADSKRDGAEVGNFCVVGDGRCEGGRGKRRYRGFANIENHVAAIPRFDRRHFSQPRTKQIEWLVTVRSKEASPEFEALFVDVIDSALAGRARGEQDSIAMLCEIGDKRG